MSFPQPSPPTFVGARGLWYVGWCQFATRANVKHIVLSAFFLGLWDHGICWFFHLSDPGKPSTITSKNWSSSCLSCKNNVGFSTSRPFAGDQLPSTKHATGSPCFPDIYMNWTAPDPLWLKSFHRKCHGSSQRSTLTEPHRGGWRHENGILSTLHGLRAASSVGYVIH